MQKHDGFPWTFISGYVVAQAGCLNSNRQWMCQLCGGQSILQQHVQKMQLPPNFLDEISKFLIKPEFLSTLECQQIIATSETK